MKINFMTKLAIRLFDKTINGYDSLAMKHLKIANDYFNIAEKLEKERDNFIKRLKRCK